jgi:hypothetical protein
MMRTSSETKLNPKFDSKIFYINYNNKEMNQRIKIEHINHLAFNLKYKFHTSTFRTERKSR